MIYSLFSWEKIDQLQPWIFSNGNIVVVQRPKFFTSPIAYILGIFLIFLSVVSIVWIYFSNEFSSIGINSAYILGGLSIIPGILLSLHAKKGIELRQEQRGIHPTDTLIVFDGSKKTVFKQKGNTEEVVTSFQDMRFEIQIQRDNKRIQYKIQMTHPQGKEHIATTTTQKLSNALLQNIKTRLHIA